MCERVGARRVREACVKCAECSNRRFLPVTDDVIRWHLSGRDAEGQTFVAGIYPLLPDETCSFLAVDFDKANRQGDATAFLDTCRRLSIPATLERSRSGRGGHVWTFFEDAIPAAMARRLGSYVLTETMESRPDIGLDSYDRYRCGVKVKIGRDSSSPLRSTWASYRFPRILCRPSVCLRNAPR